MCATYRARFLLAGFILLAAHSARAQSSYPMVMSLSPLAVQTGQTSEHEVSARYNLYGAYQVFLSGAGVTGEVSTVFTPPADPAAAKPEMPKIKLRFIAAADAVPGVRSFRVVTPQGASTVGQIVVVRDPVLAEAANNDNMAGAQAVTLPATMCGALEKAEDVDYFKFAATAGSAWTFHVQSSRCENQIHDLQVHSDPILTLKNSTGTVLAANDNYFFGDPLLYFQFPADGEYFLEIRDVRYQGNADWQYSIEANTRPFVTSVYPSRVTPGAATRVQLVGYNLPADPTALITLAPDAPEGRQWINLALADNVLASPAPVVVSRLPEALEAEAENNLPAQAQPIAVPSGLSGRAGAAGDVDCFAFDAKAGEKFTFEVMARRHQSALDPTLRILNDQGAQLAENDDLSSGRHTHGDSLLENWAAPADGRYIIELRDLHLGGGPDYVYFLQVTRSQPYFSLDTDTDKTLLSPGGGAALYVRVYRKNGFTGPIWLNVEGLPPGVTATCGRILAEGNDGCILLQAAPDAPRGASNLRITGTALFGGDNPNRPPMALTAEAFPMQEIYMPGGGRYHYPTEMHTLSVGDVMDLKSVKLSATAITLKPGASQRIDVTIERKEGFKGNVTLDVVYQHLGSIFGNSLPPGVAIDEKNSQTLISGEQSAGYITLMAAADAKPVDRQLVAMMANVSINFVMKYTYCGEPLLITVTPP